MTHLFVIGINSSGTNALVKSLARCSKTTSFSKEGAGIARDFMPNWRTIEHVGLFSECLDILENEENFVWRKIKSTWATTWGHKSVRIEKTPQSIFYVDMLEKHFENSKFLVTTRDPYAVIESINRRKLGNVVRAAKHVNKCMDRMKDIIKKDNSVWVKYEDLCENGPESKQKILELIPELEDLSFNNFNLMNHKIKNLNREQIEKINAHLDKEVLSTFGYKLL